MDALARLGEADSEFDEDSELLEMFLDSASNVSKVVVEAMTPPPEMIMTSTLANLTSH